MRDLMQLQLATLFKRDSAGRLVCENEPGDPPCSRLFVGRTLEGHVWAYRHDLPADLVAALEPILRAEPIPSELGQPLRYLSAIRTLMGVGSSEWSGPAYAFPAVVPDLHGAEVVAPADLACLEPHFGWLIAGYTAWNPIVAWCDSGVAVAACWCSRRSDRAAEAGIEVHESWRGRGIASACAARWGRAVAAAGLQPLYSTSWENLGSQGVARRLGLIRYGEDWSIW
ncbi:MAG: hypothetical protein Fur005_00940 [Roseiflexaceae bacterium]